jgi:hypothetical protein
MFWGRVACVPISLAGMAVSAWWARRLFGPASAWTTLLLWCFSPYALGHGHLISPDFAAAVMAISVAACYWAWHQNPGWGPAFRWGMVLGLALLTKHTLAVLAPLAAGLALLPPARTAARQARLPARLAQALTSLCLSLLVLNLGYGFQDSGKALGEYGFISPWLASRDGQPPPAGRFGNRFQGSILARLPLPLPGPYVRGADIQWGDFYSGRISYLRGEFRQQGWWYYYLYGLAVKTPLGVLGLLGVALGLRRLPGMGAPWRHELLLLAPSLVLLALVSAHAQCTQNLRYALPALPGLLVWISSAARGAAAGGAWAAVAIWGLVGWAVASSILWLPHSLAYFNELTGIPADGASHLLDSNIDWGQDLFRLQAWVEAHPRRRPLFVEFYGPIHPEMVGIQTDELVSADDPLAALGTRPGWYVISINYLRGYSMGGMQPARDDRWLIFRERVPVERIGETLYVYHVPPR